MKTLKISLVCATAAFVSACAITPESFETEPVQVQTAKGTVTCQLYKRNRVTWDRAIDRPSNMSVQEADNVCRAEGTRLLNS